MNLKYLAATVALITLSSTVITGPAEAAPGPRPLWEVIIMGEPTAIACVHNVYITSSANNRIVSAEMSYNGGFNAMLRARAFSVGPWELFTVCRDRGSTYLVFFADNGRAVREEETYKRGDYGILRAQSDTVGILEKFEVICLGNSCTIQSQANGLYVSTEVSYNGSNNGMLRARASVVGPWEKYS